MIVGLLLGAAAGFLLLFGEYLSDRIRRTTTVNRGDES